MQHVLDNYLVHDIDGANAVYIGAGSSFRLGKSTEEKIRSFANLPNGWDYGQGGPIPQHTRELALAWNRILQTQLGETDAFPGGEGEIVIATGDDPHYLELIIEPDNSVSLAYDFQGKQAFYRPNMSAIEAVQAIIELTGQICGVSGYYTQTNTIRNEGNLHGQRFATQRTMGVYPLSGWNVSATEENLHATTSETFIKDSLESSESLPFFGSLNPIFYQHHTR